MKTPTEELEALLESISYELTSARAAGFERPEAMRAAIRKARDLLSEADALAGHVLAAERPPGED